MSHLGLEHNRMRQGAEAWDRLAGLMDDSAGDLESASVAGLAASVQGSARSFLNAWHGYAGESAEIARGMGEALRATSTDAGEIDDATAELFDRLDVHLREG